MADKPYDAGDETQTKVKKSKRELIEDREANELKTVLDTYEGRAVLWRVLSTCGVYKESFALDSRIYYYEGKRSIGLELLEMITTLDKNVYSRIRDEATERES